MLIAQFITLVWLVHSLLPTHNIEAQPSVPAWAHQEPSGYDGRGCKPVFHAQQ
jgi:hypothetical protein